MRRVLRFFFLLGLLCLAAGCASTTRRDARVGFGLSTPADVQTWANHLGAGWYLNWQAQPTQKANGLDYWPMVRSRDGKMQPDETQIRQLAERYPGMTWIVGNEPDNAEQDDLTPAEYATFLYSVRRILLAADPGAQIAVGGVTQPTPLRMAYLDAVLESYQAQYGETLPADWWTVHAYVLREERGSWGAGVPVGLDASAGLLIEPDQHGNLARFEQNLMAFRAWMKANGYQNTPLAVTEFGILLPDRLGYSPEVVANFLQQSFAWLGNASDPAIGNPNDGYRLVQRWAWFSLADETYPGADLADLSSRQLTPAGEAFRTYTHRERP
jgi:hypothetical protein